MATSFPVTVTSVAGKYGDVTLVQGDITNLVSDLAAKAPLASPTFTGTPAAPTPGTNINTTQIPTTAWVNTWYAAKASPTFTGTVSTAAITATGTILLSNVDGGLGIGANGLDIITATAAKGAGVRMANASTGATNVWQFFAKGSTTNFVIGRANLFDALTIDGTTGGTTWGATMLLSNVDGSQGIGANGLRIVTATAAKGAGVQMGNANTGATDVWQFFALGSSTNFVIGRANLFNALTLDGTTGAATCGSTVTATGFIMSPKPNVTGSRGGNAALADLLTKLAAIGLITDGTS